MRRLTVTILGAVAMTAGALTAGCSEDPGTTTPAVTAPMTVAALPKCSEVFKLGQKIDQAKAQAGCLDPDGGVQFVGGGRCNDGRHLWQIVASTGTVAGWGFSGDVYHATKEAASDPAYKAAYDACVG